MELLFGAWKIHDMKFKVEETLHANQANSNLKRHTCYGRPGLKKKNYGDSNK